MQINHLEVLSDPGRAGADGDVKRMYLGWLLIPTSALTGILQISGILEATDQICFTSFLKLMRLSMKQLSVSVCLSSCYAKLYWETLGNNELKVDKRLPTCSREQDITRRHWFK